MDRAFHAARHQRDRTASLADLAHLAPDHDASRLPAHVVADALAAAALARAAGVGPEAVAAGLRAFAPGAHRLVTVATRDGVTWVDDSKATNPRGRRRLASLPAGTGVWIVGGDAKGAGFDDLVREVVPHLRAAVVIGRDQRAVLDALDAEAPALPRVLVPDAAAAEATEAYVRAAADLAQPGDTVMLAPACASWDRVPLLRPAWGPVRGRRLVASSERPDHAQPAPGTCLPQVRRSRAPSPVRAGAACGRGVGACAACVTSSWDQTVRWREGSGSSEVYYLLLLATLLLLTIGLIMVFSTRSVATVAAGRNPRTKVRPVRCLRRGRARGHGGALTALHTLPRTGGLARLRRLGAPADARPGARRPVLHLRQLQLDPDSGSRHRPALGVRQGSPSPWCSAAGIQAAGGRITEGRVLTLRGCSCPRASRWDR